MSNSRSIPVALVQQSCSESKTENLVRTQAGIEKASESGAELIVLQELHTTPYFCQSENPNNFDLAEPIPGETTELLANLAKKTKTVIVSSLFEKRAPGLYHNTAVVFDKDGSIAGMYRKMHIPDDPGYYEKYYFTPGDLGFKPIPTSIGKLGVLICWDQWYPEAARVMALNGAEVLIYPTAIGWDPNDSKTEQQIQLDTWITSQRAHAIANGLPVISCNRVGLESDPTNSTPGQKFWGNSFIVDAGGQIIKQASASDEQVLTSELDLSQTEQRRRIWPFLRDRRIDAYQDILKRYCY